MVIEKLDSSNPFADYGSILVGRRFVGRKKEMIAIQDRVLGESYGNIAIVGLPRIGKSSLVWNSLLLQKEELAKKKHEFFQLLIQSALDEIELDCEEKLFTKLKVIYLEFKSNHTIIEKTQNILKFFKFIKRSFMRLIFILDEFDNVKRYFQLEDFIFLREIASSPEMKVALVTVSRKTLQEIEPRNISDGSTLSGIFSDLRIGLFDDLDIQEYWNKLNELGIHISDNYKNRINYLVGRHPYLLDLYNYHIFNFFKNQPQTVYEDIIETIEFELKLTLFTSFENSLSLIRDENLYDKAFQLVLGPVYNVRSMDEQKLIKYDFIKKIPSIEKEKIIGRSIGLQTLDKNSYICFSTFFTEYWNLKYSEVDFWPLWKETENALRNIIKEYLSECFGEEWEDKYLEKNPSEDRKKEIEKLKQERDKYQRNFGTLASPSIIDYCYPKDLYELFMTKDWTYFSKIFKGERKVWSKIFTELAFLRNPVAHNNSEFVPQDRLNEAKKYCELLLEKINAWKKEAFSL